MNYALKKVLEKALDNPTSGKFTEPLDVIYTKLLVLPLQRAWSKKTGEQKRKFGEKMANLALTAKCFDCKDTYIVNKKRHSRANLCERCYDIEYYWL
jgi:hypothetical protein